MKEWRWSQTLSVEDYVSGLSAIGARVSPLQRKLLIAQYNASDRAVTAPELARAAEIAGGYPVVNAHYGRLGRIFCEHSGLVPDRTRRGNTRLWAVWSRGFRTPRGIVWQMLPAVARALEELGWVTPQPIELPEEVFSAGPLVEGAVSHVRVNAYERNPLARAKCIAYYGATCAVCSLDFGAVYGPIAAGFIHVHHITPLSQIGSRYEVDPIKDLRPVCPNCHAVIHLRGETRSVDEVRVLLASRGDG
jgi:5-methylcytosine-specific restriction protein A